MGAEGTVGVQSRLKPLELPIFDKSKSKLEDVFYLFWKRGW